MTWGLQQRDFPILTPGQMNPFHQALQQGLETYRGITQAQYEPLKLQADAASKLTYAQLMGPQYLAKLLGNKDIAANIPDDQKAQILGNLTRAGLNASQIEALTGWNVQQPAQNNQQNNATENTPAPAPAPTPAPSPAPQQGGLMDALHNLYKNMFGPTQTQNPAAPVTEVYRPGENLGTGDDRGMVFDKNGNNVVATPQQVSQSGNPNVQVDLGGGVTGAVQPEVGTEYPPTQQPQPQPKKTWAENIAAQKKTEAYGEEEGKLEAKEWDEVIKKTRDALIPTEFAHQNYEAMRKKYKELGTFEKGPLFGRGPAVTNTAQAFDKLAQDSTNKATRAEQAGHITNTDLQLWGKTVPSRSLGDEAFKEISNKNDALILRQKQIMKFLSEAKRRRINVNDANTILTDFIESHPIFDPQTGNLNKQNYTMSPFNARPSGKQRQTAAPTATSITPGKVRTYNPATGRIE
jgi:hypothetical protein